MRPARCRRARAALTPTRCTQAKLRDHRRSSVAPGTIFPDITAILPSVAERPDTAPPIAHGSAAVVSPQWYGRYGARAAALLSPVDCAGQRALIAAALPRSRIATAPPSTASKPPPPMGMPSVPSQANISPGFLDSDGSLGEEPVQRRRSTLHTPPPFSLAAQNADSILIGPGETLLYLLMSARGCCCNSLKTSGCDGHGVINVRLCAH